ncbi:uncharacterized protein LOC135680303 [Musa acuminata AAA Group]|uniref:uncharacterized protein LOC135680303 n=1 Tax=Musa acuminata AAA Group TaxID=214697 RepID=UPI0031CF2E19
MGIYRPQVDSNLEPKSVSSPIFEVLTVPPLVLGGTIAYSTDTMWNNSQITLHSTAYKHNLSPSFHRQAWLPLQLLRWSLRFRPSSPSSFVLLLLPQEVCAFAVSSSSNRCLLESSQDSGGNTVYQCRASEIVVERLRDWIETEQCVSVCGVDRNAVGISSDALLEPHFTQQLCSAACHQNCPNIIDLHLDLAAAEGIFLPDLCEAQRVNPHRAMVEILSSGAAPGLRWSSSPGGFSPTSSLNDSIVFIWKFIIYDNLLT